MKIQERFVKACIEGDDEEARDLFFANWDEIDVNEVDDKQSSILLRASMYGHFFVVQWLVEVVGAELDLQNDFGCTALISASMKGFVNVAQCLLSNGANVKLVTQNGKSAIDLAKTAELRELLHDYKSGRRIPKPRPEGQSRRNARSRKSNNSSSKKSKVSATSSKSGDGGGTEDDSDATNTSKEPSRKSVTFKDDIGSSIEIKEENPTSINSPMKPSEPATSNVEKKKKKGKSLKSILKSATGSGKLKTSKNNTNGDTGNTSKPGKLEKQKSEQNTSSTSPKPTGPIGFGTFRGMGLGPGIGVSRGISLNSIGIFSALNPSLSLSEVIQKEKDSHDENHHSHDVPSIVLSRSQSTTSASGKFSSGLQQPPFSNAQTLPSIAESPSMKQSTETNKNYISPSSGLASRDRPLDYSPDSYVTSRKFVSSPSSPSIKSPMAISNSSFNVIMDDHGKARENHEEENTISLEPRYMSSARIDLSVVESSVDDKKVEKKKKPLTIDEEKQLLLQHYPEENMEARLGSSKNNSSRNNSNKVAPTGGAALSAAEFIAAMKAAGKGRVKLSTVVADQNGEEEKIGNEERNREGDDGHVNPLQSVTEHMGESEVSGMMEEHKVEIEQHEQNEDDYNREETQSIHSDLLVDTGGDIGHECEVELDHWSIYHHDDLDENARGDHEEGGDDENKLERFTGSNDHYGLDCLKSSSRSSLSGEDYWTLTSGIIIGENASNNTNFQITSSSSPLNELHSIKRFNGKESRLSLKKLMPTHLQQNHHSLMVPRRSLSMSPSSLDSSSHSDKQGTSVPISPSQQQVGYVLTPENESLPKEIDIGSSPRGVDSAMSLTPCLDESYETSLPQETGVKCASFDKIVVKETVHNDKKSFHDIGIAIEETFVIEEEDDAEIVEMIKTDEANETITMESFQYTNQSEVNIDAAGTMQLSAVASVDDSLSYSHSVSQSSMSHKISNSALSANIYHLPATTTTYEDMKVSAVDNDITNVSVVVEEITNSGSGREVHRGDIENTEVSLPNGVPILSPNIEIQPISSVVEYHVAQQEIADNLESNRNGIISELASEARDEENNIIDGVTMIEDYFSEEGSRGSVDGDIQHDAGVESSANVDSIVVETVSEPQISSTAASSSVGGTPIVTPESTSNVSNTSNAVNNTGLASRVVHDEAPAGRMCCSCTIF